LEIFSVNEKVCFGKQRSQYSERTSFHYPCCTQTSIAEASIIALRPRARASERLSRSRNDEHAIAITATLAAPQRTLVAQGFRRTRAFLRDPKFIIA
jgi:uncharacterized membrane protein